MFPQQPVEVCASAFGEKRASIWDGSYSPPYQQIWKRMSQNLHLHAFILLIFIIVGVENNPALVKFAVGLKIWIMFLYILMFLYESLKRYQRNILIQIYLLTHVFLFNASLQLTYICIDSLLLLRKSIQF